MRQGCVAVCLKGFLVPDRGDSAKQNDVKDVRSRCGLLTATDVHLGL